MFRLRQRNRLLFTLGLMLISAIGVWFGTRAVANATNDTPVSPLAAPSPAAVTAGSLHNPGFDNRDWYWFHERYDPSYPPGPGGMRPLLPDDDSNSPDHIPVSQLQDWRLWYIRDTPLIQTFAEASVIQAGVEAVTIRTYDGDIHQGGLYQTIYDTTPCLLYNFQIYGRSQPDPGQSPYTALRAGIDQVGWHPNTEGGDPAVGAFPATTVWGAAADYKFTFGLLTVTAEARASKIAAYAYADARGGRRNAIIWDTGSLSDVTPEMIHDPDNLPTPDGNVYGVSAVPGSNNATISWNTINNALGQVYYRLIPSEGTVPPDYPYTLYLPIIKGGVTLGWMASPLNKTPMTVHSAALTGLLPDSTYEYRVVSRGLSGDVCTTWVSAIGSFDTLP